MNFNFKKWNTITGWIVFVIALATYCLTVEPTLSFWDCGEYIATAAKLEVGHPPGAPLFQMLGAFFAMFATSNENVALMVNLLSVFSSAFTILFMFWSMTLILEKILPEDLNKIKSTQIMMLGSAAVGSLAYTFSDSFWFNAVEAEVYAMASLLVALLMWLGLRWEKNMDLPDGHKWLLVIALVLGLSFGVHIMALLTIPSLGLIYYFKRYKEITWKNFIVANVVIFIILYFTFKFLLPIVLAVFGKTEIFMVNSMGLPFNSGTIFSALLFIALFYFGFKYTKKTNKAKAHTVLLSVLFMFIGFSTWLMLPIRSNANVVINENKPSDAAEVLAYYNREQYGEQNTFWGPFYTDMYAGTDSNNPYKDEKPNYERDEKTGKYVIVNHYENAASNPNPAHVGFLPRMWWPDSAVNYMAFSGVPNFRIQTEYAHEDELVQIVTEVREGLRSGKIDNDGIDKFFKTYGQYLIIDKPTFAQNISFMFEFQFGYMYMRYLLWNFVGKQNDIQGKYDNKNGNWLSGINFLDEVRLGSQTNLPDDVKNDKSRNTYYFLPFILAVLGMVWHAKKDWKSFYVLLVLFLFTSLALKVFLNERPFEPRERDYAVVPSFYVFAIWLGFGVFAIYEEVKKYISPKIAVPVVLAVSMLAAPVLMAKENWDDHNRSGKTTAVAMAKAYLDSCEPNAILFTIGDNDTFPLWYMQEIENYRTDVRIVNTQLLNTDWYIDQMKAKAYDSEPVPILFKHSDYVGNNRDMTLIQPLTEERLPISEFMKFIKTDDQRAMRELNNGQWVHIAPADKIFIPVDKQAAVANKVVSAHLQDSIVSAMDINFKSQVITKNRLMMLEIVANNNWKRPIHFSGGAFDDEDYIWLKDYLQLSGMTYKLVPIKTTIPKNGSLMDMGGIDSEKLYKTFMSWDWGSNGNPNVLHDIETKRQCINYRTNMARLVEVLINEGKKDKAEKIMDLAMEKMPVNLFGYYRFVDPYVMGYYEIGKKEKARKVAAELLNKYTQTLEYHAQTKATQQNENVYDIASELESYRAVILISKDANDLEFYNEYKTKFNNLNKKFERFGREME
ncbi:MAG: DUF2723 domain-containing protein [Flavobacterium sp.]|nr:DUF2723 domain-containing protein [Candidatus Neoflavobacterium equi]